MRREDEDGVELEPDEQALVAKLRALAPQGSDPDWGKLEAQIRAAVGPLAPRPWWQRWQALVPLGALAATAAVALIVVRHPDREPSVQATRTPPHDAGSVDHPPPAQPGHAMWLDGEALDLDDVDPAAIDDLDSEARDALGADVRAAQPSDPGDVTSGLLPVADYGWVDSLDDRDLERAESWLARKKS